MSGSRPHSSTQENVFGVTPHPSERLPPQYIGDYYYDPETLSVVSFFTRNKERNYGSGMGVWMFLETFHESMHWIHHSGTSAGAFHSSCKYALESSFLESFEQLPKRVRTSILSNRFGNNRKPVVPVGRNALELEFVDGCADADIMRQRTYDLWILRAIQYGGLGIRSLKLYKPIQDIIALALGDVAKRAAYTLNVPYDASVCPVVGDCLGVSGGDRQLSTYLLFEQLAVANELLFSLRLWGEVRDPQIKHEILSTAILKASGRKEYWIAANMLARSLGVGIGEVRRRSELMYLLCSMCDIALNPPLPPCVIVPEAGYWAWDDIHPPRRFEKLLSALPEVLRSDDPSPFAWCRLAGITWCNKALPSISPEWHKQVESLIQGNNHTLGHEYDWYNFAMYTFGRSRMEREKRGGNLWVAPALLQEIRVDVHSERMERESFEIADAPTLSEAYWTPPLKFSSDMTVETSDFYSNVFRQWMAQSVSGYYLVQDLCFSVLDLQLPQHLVNIRDDALTSSKAWLASRLKCDSENII